MAAAGWRGRRGAGRFKEGAGDLGVWVWKAGGEIRGWDHGGHCASAARGRRTCHAGPSYQRGERQRAASARANGPKRGAGARLLACARSGPREKRPRGRVAGSGCRLVWAVCRGRGSGPVREGKERADWAGKLGRGVGCWAVFLGWAGLLKGLGFLFPILFYFKHHSNYLNSNSNLNSTLALKQIKQCISMNATTNFKLRQNFNNL